MTGGCCSILRSPDRQHQHPSPPPRSDCPPTCPQASSPSDHQLSRSIQFDLRGRLSLRRCSHYHSGSIASAFFPPQKVRFCAYQQASVPPPPPGASSPSHDHPNFPAGILSFVRLLGAIVGLLLYYTTTTTSRPCLQTNAPVRLMRTAVARLVPGTHRATLELAASTNHFSQGLPHAIPSVPSTDRPAVPSDWDWVWSRALRLIPPRSRARSRPPTTRR